MPVFVIRNQQGQFLNKQKEWQDSGDNRSLMRLKYHDEALNVVFELSSKDIYLRAIAVECEQDSSGHPVIIADDMPMPFSGSLDESETADETEASESPEENSEADLALEAEPAMDSALAAELSAEESSAQSPQVQTDDSSETSSSSADENNSEFDEEAELAAALAEERAEQALIAEESNQQTGTHSHS